jgi:hypothetical protein
MSKYKQFPTPAAHLANYLKSLQKPGWTLSRAGLLFGLAFAVPGLIRASWGDVEVGAIYVAMSAMVIVPIELLRLTILAEDDEAARLAADLAG